ncbi:DUF2726 domain-containing protein [Xenorhabdus bovienii]|uniref:DUF2726 domain-containing protein n=1 Tax=Xenorhabdus bovienii TaxID=40576 RepID=UPI003DA50693
MNTTYWLLFILFAVALIIFKYLSNKPRRKPTQQSQSSESTQSIAEKQLISVVNNTFKKRTIMNKSEYYLFCKLEKFLNLNHPSFRIFPQVSLGEIIGSDSKKAYLSINSKRVDFAIIDQKGEPFAVVEYQGSGHYQGNAAVRDTIKKEACNKAGIRYFEIPAKYGEDDVNNIGLYLNTLSN